MRSFGSSTGPLAATVETASGYWGRRPIVVETRRMAFKPSPSPTVWRKRLMHVGPAESGRVTSIVRFDAGASFDRHEHPAGEEILVLEGTFSDETGDYPAGSYLFNPEGFAHAPFSRDGCLLFVKLRHHPGTGRRRIAANSDLLPRRPGWVAGSEVATLYRDSGFPEHAHLLRVPAGSRTPLHDHGHGEEIFVLEGGYADEHGAYGPGTWVCYPPGSSHTAVSDGGALMYIRTGGLFDGFGPPR